MHGLHLAQNGSKVMGRVCSIVYVIRYECEFSHVFPYSPYELTAWGRVTHICIGILTIIGSDNGMSPGRRQAIIRTNAGIWLIGSLGTKFIEISIEFLTSSCKEMCLKVSSAKWRLLCLGLNVWNDTSDPTLATQYLQAIPNVIFKQVLFSSHHFPDSCSAE